MARTERAEVVVVGAGLLGLAAARALHQRGREVIVLEQAEVGHRRGGSHGASRIFRLGYDDVRYVHMAKLAGGQWRDLEADAGETLLEETGQVSFGDDLGGLFDAMQRGGAPAEWITTADVAERFPDLAPVGPALYEPASGVLAAEASLHALARTSGSEIREHTQVQRIVDGLDRVRVETASGALHADVAVVCPGPWSPSVLPAIDSPSAFTVPPTFATLEHVAYVEHRSGTLPRTPIFIAHERPAPYGLPTRALGRYKIALHHAGAAVDAGTADLAPDERAVHALQEAAARWLPGFESTPTLVETCLYDNTTDEHFVLDRAGRVVIGAGTSGHGFKFGPLLGEVLADLATGAPPRVPIDLFSVTRRASRGR